VTCSSCSATTRRRCTSTSGWRSTGRSGFGALLIGYYDGGRLRYAGKVGTGYNQKVLRSLRVGEGERVAQIGFTEWTNDGRLRHPRFTGLRNDKPPTEVVRETS
jgi:ATP-dependent DNA ligase